MKIHPTRAAFALLAFASLLAGATHCGSDPSSTGAGGDGGEGGAGPSGSTSGAPGSTSSGGGGASSSSSGSASSSSGTGGAGLPCMGDGVGSGGEPANAAWSFRFGDGKEQKSFVIAPDTKGNVLVGGAFQGSIDIGGNVLTSAGGYDLVLMKLSSSGAPIWQIRAGATGDQVISSLAVDAADNVLVAGDCTGTIDLGGGELDCGPFVGMFIAKFSSDGVHLWSTKPKGATVAGASIAVDAADNALLTGYCETGCNFGGPDLLPMGAQKDNVFAVKLDPDGKHLWSRRFVGGSSSGDAIAVDPQGDVVIAGQFRGTADLGAGPVTAEPCSGACEDVFAMKLAGTDGATVWSKHFPGADDDNLRGLTLTPDGGVVLAGDVQGSVDFGGGPLLPAGGLDAFLVKLNASGDHVWSKLFGDMCHASILDVSATPSGDLYATGNFAGSIDFGGGPLTSAAAGDIFVVKLDASGTHVRSHRLGGGNGQSRSIAVDAAGGALVTGWFKDDTDFGNGPLTNAGLNDSFVARLPP